MRLKKAFRIAINILLVLAVWLAVSFYLQLESSWGLSLPGWLRFPGGLMIAAGLGLIGLGEWSLITRGGASGAPGNPTIRLVTDGVYAWTRNPLYTGGGLVIAGLAFLRASPGILAAAGVFLVLANLFVVFYEEPRTARRFGEPYEAYRRTVPRWGLGRASRGPVSINNGGR